MKSLRTATQNIPAIYGNLCFLAMLPRLDRGLCALSQMKLLQKYPPNFFVVNIVNFVHHVMSMSHKFCLPFRVGSWYSIELEGM